LGFETPSLRTSSVGIVKTDPSVSLCFRFSREARRETLISAARSSANSLTRQVRKEALDMAAVAKGVGFRSIVMDMMMKDGLVLLYQRH
jgi:hypothetical protein